MLTSFLLRQRIAAAEGRAGMAVWFTGLSGAGKTTICRLLVPELRLRGYRVQVLDGDILRQTLCRDLGFSKADRDENIRRISALARPLVQRGYVVLVAAISPYREARRHAQKRIHNCIEVYVDAPLSACIRRDPKQLYARALAGELRHCTGIDDPYEPPLYPDVHCKTDEETSADSAAKVLAAIDRVQQRTQRSPNSKQYADCSAHYSVSRAKPSQRSK
jgi:adenylylsulfate kinase